MSAATPVSTAEGHPATVARSCFAGESCELAAVGEKRGNDSRIMYGAHSSEVEYGILSAKNFDTEVDLAPNQKFEIKTDLLKEASTQPVAQ